MTSAAPTSRPSSREWIGLAARLVLGIVWLAAGLLKIGHLEESVLAVRSYQILPYDLAVVVGYLLPMLEIIAGLLLVLGLFVRPAAAISTLLLVAFMVGIGQAWARGLPIDCGCFGGGGEIPAEEAMRKYPWELARDAGLLALAVWLMIRPRTRFSLDATLFDDTPAPAGGGTSETPDGSPDDDALKEEHVR